MCGFIVISIRKDVMGYFLDGIVSNSHCESVFPNFLVFLSISIVTRVSIRSWLLSLIELSCILSTATRSHIELRKTATKKITQQFWRISIKAVFAHYHVTNFIHTISTDFIYIFYLFPNSRYAGRIFRIAFRQNYVNTDICIFSNEHNFFFNSLLWSTQNSSKLNIFRYITSGIQFFHKGFQFQTYQRCISRAWTRYIGVACPCVNLFTIRTIQTTMQCNDALNSF